MAMLPDMASPIEPTPPLGPKESEQLRRELEQVCTPSEAARRVELAEKRLAQALGTTGTVAKPSAR